MRGAAPRAHTLPAYAAVPSPAASRTLSRRSGRSASAAATVTATAATVTTSSQPPTSGRRTAGSPTPSTAGVATDCAQDSASCAGVPPGAFAVERVTMAATCTDAATSPATAGSRSRQVGTTTSRIASTGTSSSASGADSAVSARTSPDSTDHAQDRGRHSAAQNAANVSGHCTSATALRLSIPTTGWRTTSAASPVRSGRLRRCPAVAADTSTAAPATMPAAVSASSAAERVSGNSATTSEASRGTACT